MCYVSHELKKLGKISLGKRLRTVSMTKSNDEIWGNKRRLRTVSMTELMQAVT